MLVVELVLDVADEKGGLAHTSFSQQNYFEVVLSQCTISGHCGSGKIILSSRAEEVIEVAVHNNVKPRWQVIYTSQHQLLRMLRSAILNIVMFCKQNVSCQIMQHLWYFERYSSIHKVGRIREYFKTKPFRIIFKIKYIFFIEVFVFKLLFQSQTNSGVWGTFLVWGRSRIITFHSHNY